MAVKRAGKKHLAKKKEVLEVTQLPDVFDEDSSTKARPVVVQSDETTEEVSSPVVKIDQKTEELPSPRPPRIVTEVEEEELVVPTEPEAKEEPPVVSDVHQDEPTFTVRQNGQTVEQKLPSFFVDGSEPMSTEKPKEEVPMEPQSQETQALEAAVPQAFVSEVRQVASEVKRERKGTLVTVFIIFGMILVAGGVLGLFVMNTRKQNGSESSKPEPTAVVESTPIPTPTVIINTGDTGTTASVSAEIKKEVKVNVLNGTTIKGLANKEAAVLRKNDFLIGVVGNGEPAKAGTIVVPTGRLDMGEEIKSLLTDFMFTVTEDSGITTITVTLGEPITQ